MRSLRVVLTLSRQLQAEFGNGFSRPNLFRMVRFAEAFPDPQIVSTLSKQLSWSHFVEIIALDDPLRRTRHPCPPRRGQIGLLPGQERESNAPQAPLGAFLGRVWDGISTDPFTCKYRCPATRRKP